MQMTFGRMSEPLTKVQKVDSTKTAQSYDFMYKYEDSNHPTAPTQIGHDHYTYDAYLPYGELLVDEHTSSEDMPYKFNGKELDQETGLYYYGARYMNPVMSLWYGVDALAEKYPSIGGYVYCVGNPIKCVDLDGKAVWLFATKLPGTHVPLATHTFVVVTGDNGKVLRYAAYGPQNGNPIGGDKLTECHYPQDQQVFTDLFKGKLNENLKGHPQKVKIPKGMTSNEFDKK